MRLVHTSTGKEVQIGDSVVSFREEKATIVHITKPHKPASTGRVGVKFSGSGSVSEYFPGVFGLDWIEREDR